MLRMYFGSKMGCFSFHSPKVIDQTQQRKDTEVNLPHQAPQGKTAPPAT